MTLLPPGVKVHLALGYTDMRKGIDGLAMLVQGVLRQGRLEHGVSFSGLWMSRLAEAAAADVGAACEAD
jgi:hypothetical protein